MPAARDAHKAKPRQATGERPFFCTADVRKERLERAAFFGSPAHLGSVNLEMLTGTRMIHVPFKDTVQIYVSVGNGDVSWAFGSIGSRP